MIGKRGSSRQRIMETRGRPCRRLDYKSPNEELAVLDAPGWDQAVML